MTITLAINQAALARKVARQGRAIEAVAAALLEEAVHLPASAPARPPETRRTGQVLIDASAKVRGLLTDDEVDSLFRTDPSFARPVDFE